MDIVSITKNCEKVNTVMEERLYIPVGEQDFARNKGVMFRRKRFFDNNSCSYFFISPSLDENKTKMLSEMYGQASKEAKEKEELLLKQWVNIIQNGDNFDCLRFSKKHGLPKNEKVLEKLFLKFMNRKNGDYPVSWEHACSYIPGFEESYGYNKFLELHREYDISGNVVESISNSKMKNIDKYFLYFVYEINE